MFAMRQAGGEKRQPSIATLPRWLPIDLFEVRKDTQSPPMSTKARRLMRTDELMSCKASRRIGGCRRKLCGLALQSTASDRSG